MPLTPDMIPDFVKAPDPVRPPNLVQIGDIWICEDQDQTTPDKIEFALLIKCSSAEQCRQAMAEGKIEFTVFKHY